MKRVHVPSQFNSLFIRYISTAKSISLVRVYIEIKINKHDICFDLANFEVSKKYITTLQLQKMNQLESFSFKLRMNASFLYHVCIMKASEIYHRCNILKRDHAQYSLNVKRPVLEDKGKYIALSQLISKMHHECVTNESCLYHVTFDA